MSNTINSNTHTSSKWDEYLKSLRAEVDKFKLN